MLKYRQNKYDPVAADAAIVKGEKFRITILTPSLVRLEYSESGIFMDEPTQVVLNRSFDPPAFITAERNGFLFIETDSMLIKYDKKAFTPYGLSIRAKETGSLWHFGCENNDYEVMNNLGGTARTLDSVDGETEIGTGLLSRLGWSVLDDSSSLVIKEDGSVAMREQAEMDYYFFAHGHRYLDCIRDFYKLTGETPLLPRFALGNWWSRYHRYTQEEYQELITRMEEEKVPMSVAVIDMDWHLVDDVPARYGSGWTGYTWNKKFFPDHVGFLKWLHEHGLKTSLNIHPADGVRGFEDCYEDFARAMGMDPVKEDDIEFDMSDPLFTENYFKYINHKMEEEGVDFQWIDWQQGTVSRMEGLDPLWLLNHYYFLDAIRNGERNIIFSRYFGPGSHRYPIGFSGDTHVTWESLDFQPYFTVRASNVGYSWWSHDIGGHTFGYRDDELEMRWYQFGMMSPILRLHSCDMEFLGKEPWKYPEPVCSAMKEVLRLRARMVPYLYSMNYLTYKEGMPIVTPLYFEEPERSEAYDVRNEYYFGTELLACPITVKADSVTLTAPFSAWIPKGAFYDLTSGIRYRGGRRAVLSRPLTEYALFIKEGGILPLDMDDCPKGDLPLPVGLEIVIGGGKDGSFTLYEDDGLKAEPAEEDMARTLISYDHVKGRIVVAAAEGDRSALPAKRDYTFRIYGVTPASKILSVSGTDDLTSSYDSQKHILTISVKGADTSSDLEIICKDMADADNDLFGALYTAIERMQAPFYFKQQLLGILKEKGTDPIVLSEFAALPDMKPEIMRVLSEIILA
ncbi:glycoside hydrolase family 31 protein [Butyrivibrio sp. MC2013]|uniref:glycoside hydrolase family 31 protein n=1 Tax=Butyrivibrio sp. MC2013 TaxID=1280686 RepID=UPI000413E540|nr:glycoside hydrolase family 31 protein [Butyrivibrio sp. MC2013]